MKTKDFGESLEAKWWIKGTSKHGEESQRHWMFFHECVETSGKSEAWPKLFLKTISVQIVHEHIVLTYYWTLKGS